MKSTRQTERGIILTLEPTLAQRILKAIEQGLERFTAVHAQPIVSCLPVIRSQFRRLTEKFFPNLVVLSHSEIAPDTKIESLGIVKLSDANQEILQKELC